MDFGSADIIGPFLFEIEQGEAVTVNGDRYGAILNEFLFIKIEKEDVGNIWFQQDVATCHTAEATLDVFRPVVVVWPPRSGDLTPLDNYLWRLLQSIAIVIVICSQKFVLCPVFEDHIISRRADIV